MRKRLMALGGLLLIALQMQAQTARISVSRPRILLGEQFDLRMEAEAGLTEKPVIFPRLPDSLNRLEVIRRGKLDSVRTGDKIIYSQVITMTGFDSGVWVIPAQVVAMGNKKLRTDSVQISVMPVVLKDSAYHDIRDIVDVPGSSLDWKRILLMVSGVILILTLVWYWWKNRSRTPAIRPVDRLGAYEEALAVLEKIRKEGQHEVGNMKAYYSGVYDVYRVYLGRISGRPLMQATTEDLVLTTREWQGQESFASTVEVLRITDAVKFARYDSSVQEADLSWQRIRAAIEEVNQKSGKK